MINTHARIKREKAMGYLVPGMRTGGGSLLPTYAHPSRPRALSIATPVLRHSQLSPELQEPPRALHTWPSLLLQSWPKMPYNCLRLFLPSPETLPRSHRKVTINPQLLSIAISLLVCFTSPFLCAFLLSGSKFLFSCIGLEPSQMTSF